MKKQIKFSKKLIISLFLILISTSLIVTTTYAAYYGRGIFKDVFVNRKYYFSSDYLVESTDISKAETNNISTINEVIYVHVYNYDLSSGDFDDFDITFDVYAWVSNNNKSYGITVGGKSYTISSTSQTKISSDLLLEKNQQSSSTIKIDFLFENGDDYNAIPSLRLAVKATSPEFLSKKVLAASFNLVPSDKFDIQCYFEYADNSYSYDYAAFKYYVVVNGEPDKSEVKVKFNSQYFTVSAWSLNTNVTIKDISDTNYDKSINVAISRDSMIEIVFFRTNDSFWDNEKSFTDCWATIEALVSVE